MIAGEKWWKVVATRWVRCWLGYSSPPLPTAWTVLERDTLCSVALTMVARLFKRAAASPLIQTLAVRRLPVWLGPVPLCCVRGQRVWLASSVAACFDCCCTFLSLIMTYPSRVCSANSFLFSNRSSGTRRRSGGPQQPIVRVPHHQNLLPFYRNRHARWRSLPT